MYGMGVQGLLSSVLWFLRLNVKGYEGVKHTWNWKCFRIKSRNAEEGHTLSLNELSKRANRASPNYLINLKMLYFYICTNCNSFFTFSRARIPRCDKLKAVVHFDCCSWTRVAKESAINILQILLETSQNWYGLTGSLMYLWVMTAWEDAFPPIACFVPVLPG